jgi:hypothetical protein
VPAAPLFTEFPLAPGCRERAVHLIASLCPSSRRAQLVASSSSSRGEERLAAIILEQEHRALIAPRKRK